MLASLIANALGGDTEPKDFMLGQSGKQPEAEEEATLEEVLMILRGKRT